MDGIEIVSVIDDDVLDSLKKEIEMLLESIGECTDDSSFDEKIDDRQEDTEVLVLQTKKITLKKRAYIGSYRHSRATGCLRYPIC